jgi:hypothetical protein
MQKGARAGAAATAFLMLLSPAFADCPVELSTYGDTRGVAEIDFLPAIGGEISNSFMLLLDNNVVLDGTVKWEGRESRPMAKLLYKCPEGEPTAEEIAACTVWQGIVYTVDAGGKVGLLPGQGQPAPATLLFPALGPSLQLSVAYGAEGFSEVPHDVFTLKGCLE